jgi:hypothetical protein
MAQRLPFVKSSRVEGGPAREKKPRVGVGPPGERKEEVEVLVLGVLG